MPRESAHSQVQEGERARLPHGQALQWARRDTAKARERLERVYGRVPACVFFYQRDPEGPVSVTHGLRIVGRVAELYRGDHRPVLVRAVVPGGRALMEWFKRAGERSVAEDSFTMLAEALAFGGRHQEAFIRTGDMSEATVECLRYLDPFLADFERLSRNGMTLKQIADAAGIKPARAWKVSVSMRALGFELPPLRMPPKQTKGTR